MKSAKASLAAMSKTLTHMGKTMRQERKLEAQENERQGRMRDLKIAAEILDLRHASPRSRRIVFTGFNEYWRVIGKHSQPELESKLDPSVPGLLLSDIVERPVAWLWQDYLPLGALTLLEGEPGSGASLLALHIAACVTSGHALPGGATGQGMAAGDAGGDMQGEQGGAGAGFAFEQGEGAQREVVLPEPGDGALDDVGEQETRNGGVEFRLKLRLGVLADDTQARAPAASSSPASTNTGASSASTPSLSLSLNSTPPFLVSCSPTSSSAPSPGSGRTTSLWAPSPCSKANPAPAPPCSPCISPPASPAAMPCPVAPPGRAWPLVTQAAICRASREAPEPGSPSSRVRAPKGR